MSAVLLAKLALVPGVVWLASLAARRWGHSVSGYLGGLPMIGGPITLFLALDHGTAFAARSALFTLAAVVAQAAYQLAFATAGHRGARWWGALAMAWAAFAAASLAVTAAPWSAGVAFAVALAALALAWRLMPRTVGAASAPAIPRVELRLRILAALALSALILWAAPRFGPVVSGILLSAPVTGAIMPPFTLALYGPEALVRLLRGFVVGLAGFSSFFFVLAAFLVPLGIAAAFGAAVVAALAAVFVASHLSRAARAAHPPEELP